MMTAPTNARKVWHFPIQHDRGEGDEPTLGRTEVTKASSIDLMRRVMVKGLPGTPTRTFLPGRSSFNRLKEMFDMKITTKDVLSVSPSSSSSSSSSAASPSTLSLSSSSSSSSNRTVVHPSVTSERRPIETTGKVGLLRKRFNHRPIVTPGGTQAKQTNFIAFPSTTSTTTSSSSPYESAPSRIPRAITDSYPFFRCARHQDDSDDKNDNKDCQEDLLIVAKTSSGRESIEERQRLDSFESLLSLLYQFPASASHHNSMIFPTEEVIHTSQ